MSLIAFLSGDATWARSFHFRDFRYLWGATLFQALAMGMDQVALGWLVLEMTDSPFMVGVSAAVRMAPFFFLGLLSGAVADRVDRRVFLRFVTLATGAVSGLMALVLLTNEIDEVRLWQVMALAAATGCCWAFTMTIRQAYTYDIVGPEHALNGLSLAGISQQAGGVVGAVVGGVLIATVGVGEQYLGVGAAYVAAVIVLMATRDVGQAALMRRETVVQNLVGYVQILRENRTLMTLMFLAATTEIFGFTHMSLLPVLARDVLGVGAIGLGVMTAVRQSGGVLGLLVLASLGDFRRKGLLIFIIAAGFGLGQMALSVTGDLIVFVLVLAVVNACAHSVDTLYKTLMQDNVPNEQRGRAMGSWVLSIGVAPVGHVGLGAIAGALGAPAALLINGSTLLFASVSTAIGFPRIRRLP